MIITHTDIVKALVKDGAKIKEDLTPEDAHIMHMAIGISGEAGELLDAIKKKVIYRKELDRNNIIEELGDLEFFMEGLRQALNIERQETLEENIRKLSVRYLNLRYSDQGAIERKDKAA